MKVAVIGSGYVGLVSGACFSEFGINVVCVDKDHNKINNLQKNIMPMTKKINIRWVIMLK